MSSHRRSTHTGTRDAVLVAHANDMIARTNTSQRDFATALSKAVWSLIPDLDDDRKVPDFEGMNLSDADTYTKAADAWLKRVQRWLSGDVEIPSWLEEPWVTALLPEWKERCLIELAGRYGLLAVRPIVIEGMGPMQVFGGLMGRMGDVAGVGTKVFDDLLLDVRDAQHLPEMIHALDSLAANASELSAAAKQVQRQAQKA